ncbi:MAG: FKBP-type peptidyl-prolyl cis-trans isomerase [Bacteroidota bacterium]
MNLKSTLSLVFFTIISLNILAQTKKAVPKKPLANATKAKAPAQVGKVVLLTDNDSLSYSIGVNIGQSLKQQGLEAIDLNLLKTAMNDVMKGNPMAISAEQCMPIIMASMKKIQEKKFAPIKAEGVKFLATNSKKDSVVVLPSGLQYKILKKGNGEIPKASDKVNVHYHGTLINGQVFDSSVDRGSPATFGVTQVISGWVEALQLMPVGSKWKLFIPSELAYGERGAGENIPPFSTLVFEVELLSIEKEAAPENK